MAHPDHDQVIGRLVGARLRGPAVRRPGSAAAEVHPDAETWAAYVDDGLRPDEVTGLEAHLGGCAACRRLVAALAPEVAAGVVTAGSDVEATPAGGATVIPFPRRRVVAWMALAAGLFGAVTLWSVSRLGGVPDTRMAQSLPMADAPAPTPAPSSAPPEPASAPAAAGPAASTAKARAELAKPLNRVAVSPPPAAMRSVVPLEQDKANADARRDEAGRRQRGARAAGAVVGGAAGERFQEGAKPSEEKRTAEAAPSVAAADRVIQLQTNSVAAGATRPHGPIPTQQATNQAQNAPAANTQPPAAPLAATRVAVVAAPPPPAAPAPATAPATAPAQADAGAAAPRERPGNEQQVGQLSESVTITSGRAGARARRQPAPPPAAGADRDAQALKKDEAPKGALFSATAAVAAMPSFAEPGGRLLWRIADGRRIESSSDGGATWNPSHTARGRLRAGVAPAIESAWVVGERGLVLRRSVPGGWTVVSPPAAVTLTAVSATGAQSARVTADDGRVFETADGGATWTLATPGAGPQ